MFGEIRNRELWKNGKKLQRAWDQQTDNTSQSWSLMDKCSAGFEKSCYKY